MVFILDPSGRFRKPSVVTFCERMLMIIAFIVDVEKRLFLSNWSNTGMVPCIQKQMHSKHP